MTVFKPGTSIPCGFSQNTCLPAAIAARTIMGEKWDAGVMSTS